MTITTASLLHELLYQPTAPFREAHVVNLVTHTLRQAKVPWFCDPDGNVVIGAASLAAYKKLLGKSDREPLRVFVAHMDHPGFHGVRWITDSRMHVTWHGGAPVRGLDGAKVWISNEAGYCALGHLSKPRLDKKRKRLLDAQVVIERTAWWVRPAAQQLFGGFRAHSPVWREGKLIYTKAADDLVGVYAIVRTAMHLFKKKTKKQPPFIGILTRGEEVGFVGMIAHLEREWLQQAKRRIIGISLETSRALPNAEIGKGPVVRLGDRRTVFDPGYLQVLTDVAQDVLPKRHQRRIMDGGACEATAALAYGVRAIGISVPLGNYHNESFEGRYRGKPAPEYVHADDVDGLLTLCEGLMRPGLAWEKPWEKTRAALHRNFQQQRKRLGKSKK